MSSRREFSKIRGLFRRRKHADDLEEEIRSHLKMEEQENLGSGMSQEEAYRAAMHRFGNRTLARERSREMWGWNSIETLFQDLRYGLRQLRRNPGFTTVAVLTLALGIGATTAIFSVVNSVLLQPLPFKDPGRLVQFFETEQAPGNYPLSGADYLDWQTQNRTLEATSVYSWPTIMNASGAGEPESAAVVNSQANFFDVLGVQPLVGRTFEPGEDVAGKSRVAVLSYGFWQRHFGGGADTLGKTVVLNDEKYTVVGVMPRWFNFRAATDVWVPCDMSPKELGPRGNHHWNAMGRLKPGVTLGRARGDLLAISQRLEKQYPDTNNKVHAVLTPLKDTLTGDSKAPLLILLGAVMLMLLVACVNVANLQLARASTRYREMALRASLGAGRLRLVRQMLTESILLALAGAVVGILLASWCVRLLESAKSIPIPRANPVQIDGPVLLFAIAVSVLVGILFGLAPALRISELGLNEELKAGAQSVLSAAQTRQTLRDALVVAEISITLTLLVGAGLLLRSFARLRSADVGVNPRNVLTTFINLPDTKYTTLAKRRLDKSIGQFDVTHNFKFAAVYDLPFGQGRRYLTRGPASWVLGNWRITSVNLYSSGTPVAVTTSYGLALSNGRTPAYVTSYEGWQPAQWANGSFNPAVDRFFSPYGSGPFPLQGTGTSLDAYGNATRYNPKLRQFPNLTENMSITRVFPIHESVQLEFRAEAFNVFNRVRFGTGSTQLQDPNFGRLTSSGDLLNTPRQLQLALKLYF
jgi:putative ABC transport system permease protein